MTQRGTRNSLHGFSLVELLVVMGILAILIAVLTPALSNAMNHARTAKCAANLRSIAAGLITFAGDNNGNFPESGAAITYGSTDTSSGGSGLTGWTQQLEPYLGAGSAQENKNGTSIYQCPDRAFVTENTYYSYFNGAHAGYNPNAVSPATKFGAVSLIKMHAPSQHIIAGDIAFSGMFSVDDCDKDDYSQDPAFNGYTSAMSLSGTVSTIKIHGGSVNLAFADGHVENVRSYDNTKLTTHYAGIVNEAYGDSP